MADASDWIASGFSDARNPTVYATEQRALAVKINLIGAEGPFPPFAIRAQDGRGVLMTPRFPEAMVNGE